MSGEWQPGKNLAFEYRGEAEGAIPNGSTIAKINSVEGDTHTDGAIGIVVGSMGPLGDSYPAKYCYCVNWMDAPGIPVWIIGSRVREVTPS